MELFLGFIVIWLALIIGSIWLAGQKGRSQVSWGFLVAIFGIFAFIFLAFAPTKKG